MKSLITSITDQHGQLCCPIFLRDGKIAAYRITSSPSTSFFGGDLPDGLEKPSQAVIHSVATIDTASCPIFDDLEHSFMHLLYAFRHDGNGMADLEYEYLITGIKVTKLAKESPDDYWPYENYPDIFPKSSLECLGLIDADDDDIMGLLHQPVDYNDPDKIFGVVPISEEYGVSLWGDMGDLSMVQCIFEYSIKSGVMKTYNICD